MHKYPPNYVSIVIPVYNKWNFTKSCLDDLTKLSEDHEIIIINNASTDETYTKLYEYCEANYKQHPQGPVIHPIHNCENIFHSKSCNQGYAMAKGEYVIFLNNDIRVRDNHDHWTYNLVELSRAAGSLVGPTMGLLDKNLNFVREAKEYLQGNTYLGGWCIGGSKETWEKLRIDGTHQIWNEEFPFYFNDTDLSFRARRLGVKLSVIDLPDVVHFGKISAAQINIPKLYNEGRSVFLKKWGSKK
jgi:O-antigen biosynthesis protein